MSIDARDDAVTLTRWAESGLMSLTGEEHGTVDTSAAFTYAAFSAELDALSTRLGLSPNNPLRSPAIVLGGRARENKFGRRGQISAGGATRLLKGPDGWGALSLARESDRELIPALLCADHDTKDPWLAISVAAGRSMTDFIERATLLGMPASRLGESHASRATHTLIAPPQKLSLKDTLVVDLSALWAGPLCTSLLAAGGAKVVKVEFADRPDGARRGNLRFFDWLGHNKLMCEISSNPQDEAFLAQLIDAADIVIEASRPRALRQLGLSFDQRHIQAGKIWMRITGHGTEGEAENRVAFGDDAAVAGGLVGRGFGDRPVFIGDAIADPLTGVRAATEIAAAVDSGGGVLIDTALSQVAAGYTAHASAATHPPHSIDKVRGVWNLKLSASGVTTQAARPPRIPQTPNARKSGADNAEVRALVAQRVA